MSKTVRNVLKIALIVILALILLAAAYVAYVFIDYHRIEDGQSLPVSGNPEGRVRTGESYGIVSWNIGFGAYETDFGFFMDGGDESWAWSEERLNSNLGEISRKLSEQDADFYLVQEVDFDATRSYHVDERVPITEALGGGYCNVFAQNYDSPFLMYPLTQPHGASKAGIMTFSAFDISSAVRRSLPIEGGFMKFLDLDRCYSVSRVPVEGGKELVLYNLHLSAYTSDGTIATEQLKMLLGDMQGEYDRGNYCIAGGDFNKDLLGDSGEYFGESDVEYSWAQPIPEGTFDGVNISLIAPVDERAPVPSCRNADGPYHPGQYVLTVDGFMVTDNVTVEAQEVLDYGFAYSDHNPVKMVFNLAA